MGRVIQSPKQRVPVAPQNGPWSKKNFKKIKKRNQFRIWLNFCGFAEKKWSHMDSHGCIHGLCPSFNFLIQSLKPLCVSF